VGRVCLWLAGAILPVVLTTVTVQRAAAADPAPTAIKIGLPESMFSGLPPAIVDVGSQPFKAMLEKQTGLKGEIAVTKDHADTAAQIRTGKLDVAVFHGFEYAWVKEHKELVPLLVTVPTYKLHACLVVNKKSKATGPHELKGEAVIIPPATKAYCRLYLERLKDGLPKDCCGTAKIEGKSIEEALDAVASGTSEAVLVDQAALTAYQKNKPGVGEQLKVLSKSDEFPSAILVYRKGVFTAEQAKKVGDGLIKSTTTAQGQLLTSLWKLKGFAVPEDAYYAEVDKSLKAFPAPKQK
jgi:ABC-type phosphate/phosphonate transport system substrate-binding protein